MIIDTHFHGFPQKFLDMQPGGRSDSRGTGLPAFDEHEYLNVLDMHGIDIGVLSNAAGRIEHIGDRGKVLDAARVLNDTFAEAHAHQPQRFKAFARPPMLDMDDCVAELRRCFGELGLHGVTLSTNLAGKYVDEPQFAPFWEELARWNKPLFLHPANAPCLDNWNHYSLHQKMLWPADSTLALSRIVCSGIMDRYPSVKLIASHLGGMVLNYLDRLNWWEGDLQCKNETETYFRQIFYDTAGPVRAPFIKMACDTVGADQILFGADYPHGRGGRDDQFYPMTLQAMRELDVPAADKEKIYWRNAKALFGFPEG